MQISHYSIRTDRITAPITIGLVADLHGEPYQDVLSALEETRPHITAIVGDLIEKDDEPYPLAFLKRCTDFSKVYLSLGNHEKTITDKDVEEMTAIGVSVLDNSWVRYNKELIVGGMTSPYVTEWRETGKNNWETLLPEIEWVEEFEQQVGFKLLLDHHPENYPKVTKGRNIDLILSGHAHGGQIRILGQGLFSPQQGFFPKYTSGVYEGRLVVSRGLSNRKLIPRWGNPTELVFVDINSYKEPQ